MPHLPYRNYQLSAGLLLADIVLFSAVNPQRASAPWLIIGYTLLCATIWSGIASFSKLFGQSKPPKRFNRYAALSVCLLVGLQSVGQLTPKDALALGPLMAMLYLYFGYGRRVARQTA